MNSIKSVIKEFQYYKLLGEKSFNQLSDEDLFWKYNEESNSIAIIGQHLHGNMLSRWTNFLTSDGEKEWRQRDLEFEHVITTKEEMIKKWEEGWECVFHAILNLQEEELVKTVYIRNQAHTVIEAIHRQLAHYPYHIGQIVFIGKLLKGHEWNSLSIPRGNSDAFNKGMFAKPK